jgi:F-type H+-transporting ATPase subunit b
VRKLVIAVVVWCAALPAWASEGSAETFLGLPVVLWKTLNLVGFFGLLAYLLAKPMSAFFRTRREGIGRQLEEATKQRQEAERLSAEMEQKVASLEGEITAIQERLRREGEKEREALEKQGEAEAARFLAQVDQEAARRVEEARASLSREAAGIAAELAIELLEKELTDADRERIFTSTLERLKARAAGGVQ